MGLKTIKNWVTIMALATGSNKPGELSTVALTRGRCCELLAKECKLPKPEKFFTVGLFSSLDAMMDSPLEELLQELALSDDIKSALLEHEGLLGEALQCTLAMESGEYNLIVFSGLHIEKLADIYLEAINWADELTANLNH